MIAGASTVLTACLYAVKAERRNLTPTLSQDL